MVLVILLLILWSVSAIYITHFLDKRKMKVAAIAYAVLYGYLVIWSWLIFSFDFAEYGFAPGRGGLLHGSKIYFSFLNLQEWLMQLPAGVLVAVVVAVCALAVSVLCYLLISGYRIYKELRRMFAKTARLRRRRTGCRTQRAIGEFYVYPIYLRNCRWND